MLVFAKRAKSKDNPVRENWVIESEIGNPKRKEEISNNTRASEETAGWETIKILLSMGGKYLLEPEVLRSGKRHESENSRVAFNWF